MFAPLLNFDLEALAQPVSTDRQPKRTAKRATRIAKQIRQAQEEVESGPAWLRKQGGYTGGRVSEAYHQVLEFHEIFGSHISEVPDFGVPALRELRKELIREEAEEFATAVDSEDFVGALDALADLLYVTYGAAIAFGLDLDQAVRRVHASNMSKLGEDGKPIYREDGKVLKGPNFFLPKLDDLCGGVQ